MSETGRRHVARVKALPCAVCERSGPSDAHHILSGRTPGRKSPHWLTIPLCKDCHQGSRNGIHGERIMWNVMKKTEAGCLNETLEKLYGEMR
ncbi:MAG: Ref family recombination enhancement nuclease [Rhodocyclaceae bacterium]